MYKTILCYGDSNTWGFIPGKANYEIMYMERYSREKRWPGLIQKFLGTDYYIVEEGLNGRTTNLDYNFPPDRNGERYLPPCLYSHAPIDLVILALGGNDLKSYFKRDAINICYGLKKLVKIIKESKYGLRMQEPPKILIVSQPIPLPISESFVDDKGVLIFEGAIEKAKKLVTLYAKMSVEEKCFFLDVTNEIYPSRIDGIHLDEDGHLRLASLIFNKIKTIYSE